MFKKIIFASFIFTFSSNLYSEAEFKTEQEMIIPERYKVGIFKESELLVNDLQSFNENFRLIPQVQKIDIKNGFGVSYNDVKGVYLVNLKKRPVMDGILDGLSLVNKPTKGMICLELKDDLNIPSDEGYVLDIESGKIFITAKTQAGLFYGLQTLKQLMEDSRDESIPIPSCSITDYPTIPYRSVLLNFMRHLDKPKYYYDLIDRLASIKINALILEYTDKIRYKNAPVIGVPEAMSIDEYAALSRYAHDRNIEISPLVQGLGHVPYILKHDEYKSLRDDSNSDLVFDPLNPKTYDLQFSLYDDALAATPYGKYLHVGGDEVEGLGKSVLSKASGKTPFELQMYWLKKATEYASSHHRIPIFWDDMMLKHTGLWETTVDKNMNPLEIYKLWNQNRHLLDENISLFPKNCIYNRWDYSSSKILGNQLAIDWYKSQNLKVIGATSSQPGTALMPRKHSNFQAMKNFCQISTEKRMDGIICTVWDDWPVHFETVMRGSYDFALLSWNYSDISDNEAHKRFRHRFYAPALAPDSCEFQNLLEEALSFWDIVLTKKSRRASYLRLPNEIDLIDLPDQKNPGQWSLQYKAKLKLVDNALNQYTEIKSRIDCTMSLAKRNIYAASVMNQINELQNYSTKLLLLLREYDQSGIGEKQHAKELISNYVDSFKGIRSQFIGVFGKSWLMKQPVDYDATQFDQLLQNTDNNTDWMYVYELCMNKKIAKWISLVP